MVYRRLFIPLLLCLLTVVTPDLTGAVEVETYTSAEGKRIQHVLRAGSDAAVPPQDVLVVNRGAFGQLPRTRPGDMKQIIQFFARLPDRVNLRVFRGRDPDGNVKFGPLKTGDDTAFLSSMESADVPVRDFSRTLRDLLEQWPGENNQPGTILILSREPHDGSYEISPDLIKSLAEQTVVVHNLVTIPTESGTDHSTAKLSRISGGYSLTTGDVVESPRLPGTYNGDPGLEEAFHALVDGSDGDTTIGVEPGSLYRTALERLLPLHAYDPTLAGQNQNSDSLEPNGYAWTGRMPLVIFSTPPVEGLTLSDGDRTLDSVSIPRVRPEARSADEVERVKHLVRQSLERRRLIYGLSGPERNRLIWLNDVTVTEPPNGQRTFASDFIRFLTGRVAIEESFQLADWQTTTENDHPGTVPIESVDPPELQHLDYESMMSSEADTQRFPLTDWAPGGMAVVSFTGVDSALASGELFQYWSGDIVENYLDETAGELLEERVLDRLGIKMNRDMRPFYDVAVGEIGFFVNEPSLGATQDVALVMAVKNRELVEARLDQIRSKLRETYPGVSRREQSFEINGTDTSMTVFRTPDRQVSSHVWFHDGGVVIATSKQTLKRIARVKMGDRESLAERSDVQYLSQTLEPASGYLVISDSFVSKIIDPSWRMKYDRRARCLRALDRLTAQTTFQRDMFGSADLSSRPGLCSPDHAVRWENGRWVSPVYGHRQFATPIGELSISSLTKSEYTRYRQFAEQYQAQWERGVDPIGIGLDVSSGTFVDLETVILPLVNQSEYNQLSRIAREALSEPIESWQSLPAQTVFGAVFANPFAQGGDGETDTAVERFRQWEQYKQRLRDRLDWPEDQSMLDWLGSEWGVVSFDLAPEDLAGFFSDNPLGAVRRVFSEFPVAIYTDVENETRANHFLKVVKQSRDSRGRAGFRLRKRTVDGRIIYSADLFGIPVYTGVRDGKLFLTFDREFLVPLEDSTLAEQSRLETMRDRFHPKSQGLFVFQLGRATGLKRFMTPTLYPLERRRCRRQRARHDRRDGRPKQPRAGPFGGEWFDGPGGRMFCTKHSAYTDRTLWERLMETGRYPVLSEQLPVKQKLDQLDGVVLSFEVSPLEYSVHLSMEDPTNE